MLVPAAVAQVPVCWSVRRDVGTVLDAIGGVAAGTVLVLPECALSGYDDQLSGLDRLDPAELAAARGEVARAAQRSGVHVFCGTLLPEHGRWWNAAYYFPPGGEPWVYRKVNLATHERGQAGRGPGPGYGGGPVAQRRAAGRGPALPGDPVPGAVGLPGPARRPGADLSHLRGQPGRAARVWRAHLISRAAETQRFVLAANVARPAPALPDHDRVAGRPGAGRGGHRFEPGSSGTPSTWPPPGRLPRSRRGDLIAVGLGLVRR